MNITRRGFMASILALGAAPAIVRADSLMRIIPRELSIACVEGPILSADFVINPWSLNYIEESALARLEWCLQFNQLAAESIRKALR